MKLLAPLVIGLGLFALTRKGGGGGGGSTASNASWQARWAVLAPYAQALEVEWPGISRYLYVVAWMESRGRLDAVHDGGIGRGPFALHSTTITVQALGGQSALDLLEDPGVAVATAATHAYRLTRGTYHYARSDTRWRDIRAGWAIPAWVGNRYPSPFGSLTRSAVVERFEQRAAQLGLAGMPGELALPADWQWPGLRFALDLLGREQVAVDPDSPAY